jgi:hypothetical protein
VSFESLFLFVVFVLVVLGLKHARQALCHQAKPLFCSFVETGSHHVAQAGLDYAFLLPLPPDCWDDRHVSPTSDDAISINFKFVYMPPFSFCGSSETYIKSIKGCSEQITELWLQKH